MTQKAHVFVYGVERATSKAGRPYLRQLVQIYQTPVRPDVKSLHFPQSEADVLAPGHYECDVFFKESLRGVQLGFENFAAKKTA